MQETMRSSQEDVFEHLPIPIALRKMIVPAVTSQLIVLIYNMADTFFVGQTNNPYMVAGACRRAFGRLGGGSGGLCPVHSLLWMQGKVGPRP